MKYNRPFKQKQGIGGEWSEMSTGAKIGTFALGGAGLFTRIGAKGRARRKKEQAAAQDAFSQQVQAYQDFQFEIFLVCRLLL